MRRMSYRGNTHDLRQLHLQHINACAEPRSRNRASEIAWRR